MAVTLSSPRLISIRDMFDDRLARRRPHDRNKIKSKGVPLVLNPEQEGSGCPLHAEPFVWSYGFERILAIGARSRLDFNKDDRFAM